MKDDVKLCALLGIAGASISFGIYGTAQSAALGFGIGAAILPALCLAVILLALI